MDIGLNSIEEWIKLQGIPTSEINRSLRTNKYNFVIRYHIPSVEFTDEKIRLFDEFRPKDSIHEWIIKAKGHLAAEGGEIHAYRSVHGGSCIDVTVDNGEYLKELKGKIASLEEKLKPSKSGIVDEDWGKFLKILGEFPKKVAGYTKNLFRRSD